MVRYAAPYRTTAARRTRYVVRLCAWCGTRLAATHRAGLRERLAALARPVSHGLCDPCRTRLTDACTPRH